MEIYNSERPKAMVEYTAPHASRARWKTLNLPYRRYPTSTQTIAELPTHNQIHRDMQGECSEVRKNIRALVRSCSSLARRRARRAPFFANGREKPDEMV